jgi:hypothetical protein
VATRIVKEYILHEKEKKERESEAQTKKWTLTLKHQFMTL